MTPRAGVDRFDDDQFLGVGLPRCRRSSPLARGHQKLEPPSHGRRLDLKIGRHPGEVKRQRNLLSRCRSAAGAERVAHVPLLVLDRQRNAPFVARPRTWIGFSPLAQTATATRRRRPR